MIIKKKDIRFFNYEEDFFIIDLYENDFPIALDSNEYDIWKIIEEIADGLNDTINLKDFKL